MMTMTRCKSHLYSIYLQPRIGYIDVSNIMFLFSCLNLTPLPHITISYNA